MSRDNPKFGDVFRWKSDTQESLVMYVAPTKDDSWDWVGISIRDDFFPEGDMATRISLVFPAWSEVPSESD